MLPSPACGRGPCHQVLVFTRSGSKPPRDNWSLLRSVALGVTRARHLALNPPYLCSFLVLEAIFAHLFSVKLPFFTLSFSVSLLFFFTVFFLFLFPSLFLSFILLILLLSVIVCCLVFFLSFFVSLYFLCFLVFLVFLFSCFLCFWSCFLVCRINHNIT